MGNHYKIVDLALSQAIERYMEMQPDRAYAAIAEEWPEQIAVLLVELFFKTTCGTCTGIPDFVHFERENGHGSYIAPICSCEAKLTFMKYE